MLQKFMQWRMWFLRFCLIWLICFGSHGILYDFFQLDTIGLQHRPRDLEMIFLYGDRLRIVTPNWHKWLKKWVFVWNECNQDICLTFIDRYTCEGTCETGKKGSALTIYIRQEACIRLESCQTWFVVDWPFSLLLLLLLLLLTLCLGISIRKKSNYCFDEIIGNCECLMK